MHYLHTLIVVTMLTLCAESFIVVFINIRLNVHVAASLS